MPRTFSFRQARVLVVHLDLPDQVHASLSLPRVSRGIDEVISAIMAALEKPPSPTTGDSAGAGAEVDGPPPRHA